MSTTPPPPLESEVQRAGIALLRGLGWTVLRRNVGGIRVGGRYVAFGQRHQADTYGITPDGRAFECEFKRLGKVPSKGQVAWLIKMNHAGSVAFWCDNTRTLERVAYHVMGGGRIEYIGWTCDYNLVR